MRKKISFVFISTICLIISLVACDLSFFTSNQSTTSFEVSTSLPSERNSSSSRDINSDYASISSVYVKVFDANGIHLPANTVHEMSTMSYADGHWSGTVQLKSAVSGEILFTLWAIDADGHHLYSGSGTLTVGTNGNSITIPTKVGYSVGDKGPGGGYIIYSASDYTGGWKYLEASRSDFSYTWEGILIDNDLAVNTTTGDVYVTNGSGYDFDGDGTKELAQNDIAMHAYEWYWSIPDFETAPSGDLSGNLGTLRSIGDGKENNILLKLDAISGVTPQIKKMPGRKVVEASNRRRDGAKTLGGGILYDGITHDPMAINGYDDWFIPSKDELHAMYNQRVTLNLDGKYWSSTESADSDNPTNTIVGSSRTALALNAWMEEFSSGGSVQSQELRSTLAKIRPVRRF